jgi:hypothetical protein
LNYSGKKKRHTQKTQIIADKSGRKIICTAFNKGRKHDFKLFKNSKVCFKEDILCLAETAYQGIRKIHPNSALPKKKTKKNPLSKEDKKENQCRASSRISIENIIREVKIFGILAEKYRNGRRRFTFGFNLIAAIYNMNPNYK